MSLEQHVGRLSLPLTTLCFAALGSAVVCSLLKRFKNLKSSPPAIRILRGPKSHSFLWGSLGVVLGPSDPNRLSGWLDEFGSIFAFRSILGSQDILVADPKSMAFVLNRPMEFQRSPIANNFLKSIVGHGLLVAEGLAHKKQVSGPRRATGLRTRR